MDQKQTEDLLFESIKSALASRGPVVVDVNKLVNSLVSRLIQSDLLTPSNKDDDMIRDMKRQLDEMMEQTPYVHISIRANPEIPLKAWQHLVRIYREEGHISSCDGMMFTIRADTAD